MLSEVWNGGKTNCTRCGYEIIKGMQVIKKDGDVFHVTCFFGISPYILKNIEVQLNLANKISSESIEFIVKNEGLTRLSEAFNELQEKVKELSETFAEMNKNSMISVESFQKSLDFLNRIKLSKFQPIDIPSLIKENPEPKITFNVTDEETYVLVMKALAPFITAIRGEPISEEKILTEKEINKAFELMLRFLVGLFESSKYIGVV